MTSGSIKVRETKNIINESRGVLNKEEIILQLTDRKLIVEPILERDLQLDIVSIDLRLDQYFAEFRTAKKPNIDPASIDEDYPELLHNVDLECFCEYYFLQPKTFVLAQTFEYICMPNYLIGELEGRSSVARQGLMVHATAGLVDPGFNGHLVFELYNAGEMPIKLYPLMRIAKISFHVTKPTEGYAGQYSLQVKIRPPKVDKDVLKLQKLIQKREALLNSYEFDT